MRHSRFHGFDRSICFQAHVDPHFKISLFLHIFFTMAEQDSSYFIFIYFYFISMIFIWILFNEIDFHYCIFDSDVYCVRLLKFVWIFDYILRTYHWLKFFWCVLICLYSYLFHMWGFLIDWRWTCKVRNMYPLI